MNKTVIAGLLPWLLVSLAEGPLAFAQKRQPVWKAK